MHNVYEFFRLRKIHNVDINLNGKISVKLKFEVFEFNYVKRYLSRSE